MKKFYHIDTCALLEQDDTIEILKNGEENHIYISIEVLNEIDGLLKSKKRNIAMMALDNIIKNKEHISFTGDVNKLFKTDDVILDNVKTHSEKHDTNGILITNDKMLQLKSYIRGVESQPFLVTNPFKSESEQYTGFIDVWGGDDDNDYVNNCFFFKNGKLHTYTDNKVKRLSHDNETWGIHPKSAYQNATMELLLNNDINLVTIQSPAGLGKSTLAIAAGLKLVFEQKLYDKMYIVKYPSMIGEDMGFLPGDLDTKMELHWRPFLKILMELNKKRTIKKGFLINKDTVWPLLNPMKIEFLPVNYLRGDNISNAVVIISEAQNITRHDMRTILTRMGSKVKCIVEGDVSQIDNPKCSESNNALNWLVKCMKDNRRYGHILIKGENVRGNICKMILDSDF